MKKQLISIIGILIIAIFLLAILYSQYHKLKEEEQNEFANEQQSNVEKKLEGPEGVESIEDKELLQKEQEKFEQRKEELKKIVEQLNEELKEQQ